MWTYQCTGVINERTINAAAVAARDIQKAGRRLRRANGHAVRHRHQHHQGRDPDPAAGGGGSVTYSYEVTNTGNVPLADIDGRVTDDKCPNVVAVIVDGFNFGDFDHNGLLTGDADLFETGGPEVWLFTCTMTSPSRRSTR